MIVEISLRPSVSPVTAATATTAVMSVPELVMNALLPLMTHSSASASSTARVWVPPGVRAEARLGQAEGGQRLAADQPGQPLACCSSVPNR